MQQMSENFVDTFGFTDAAFNDDSEEDSNEMRRLTNVLSDEDATATASDAIKRAQGIFEAICDQRFTSFPGKFIVFKAMVPSLDHFVVQNSRDILC